MRNSEEEVVKLINNVVKGGKKWEILIIFDSNNQPLIPLAQPDRDIPMQSRCERPIDGASFIEEAVGACFGRWLCGETCRVSALSGALPYGRVECLDAEG